MLYVQTACTIALLKVETISDFREKKTLSKNYILSVQHNIILHQLHSFSSNHCPFLQKKEYVHGILLLFIEKFRN